MNYELARVIVAIAGTSIAAYQDARTSFIDDKITIAMIALGTLANFATLDSDFIMYSAGLTAVIFGLGYLFYRFGQLGGGDVLLFCGLQALLPYYPVSAMAGVFSFLGVAVPPLPSALSLSIVPFFLSIYVVSSFLAMAASGFLYAYKLYRATGFRRLHPDLFLGGLMLALSMMLLYWMAFVFSMGLERVFLAVLFLAPSVFLVFFKKDISDKVALRWISLAQMEDEDVIDTGKMPRAIVEKYGVGRVLTEEMKKVLAKISKQEHYSKFPVQKDLPRFGPYILSGLLLSLYFADPLSVFLFY